MAKIEVLDCTLRDGGYCNQWKFGKNNIEIISSSLIEAGIDIIEIGFITNKVKYDNDVSKYTTFCEAASIIPLNKMGKMFVCMINYGEYDIKDIPEYDGTSVDGIRVAFHKKDMEKAIAFCKGIKEKGYKVFIQGMVTLNYSDEEFLHLIDMVNELEPYAFYIVDSFGVMKKKDLTRLFYIVEKKLATNIKIGYHSHNNMQLAYSNAQALTDIRTKRDIIIDSSVFGMGRGAGNLNTELYVEYLNDNIGTSYNLKPLLVIIDEILNRFYQQNYWGYSLPNYLSAKHNVHPNYASFLDAKQTLTIENIDEIFFMMDDDKKADYDKEYIENLYIRYMATGETYETHLNEFKKKVAGKEVLIIAPGKSSVEEKDKIIEYARNKNNIIISINFEYKECHVDYIFLSNLRRYRELEMDKRSKCIVTSNIPSADVYIQTKYKELLNKYEAVEDNAGMMLIKYLIIQNVKKIYIAGLDGYSVDSTQNFADSKMNFYAKKATVEAINRGLNYAIEDFSKEIEMEFLTTPKFVNIRRV